MFQLLSTHATHIGTPPNILMGFATDQVTIYVDER